jgi:hypothetical protein
MILYLGVPDKKPLVDRRPQTPCRQVRCGALLEIYRHLDADEQAMANAILSVGTRCNFNARFFFRNLRTC